MKVYTGLADGGVVLVAEDDATPRKLAPRLDLWNHSPAGFAWGYGGSGPAQLALAILADYLGDDDRASRLHQPFKWDFVATWSRTENFVFESTDIDIWLRNRVR